MALWDQFQTHPRQQSGRGSSVRRSVILPLSWHYARNSTLEDSGTALTSHSLGGAVAEQTSCSAVHAWS
jgi:hypothetical protein